MEKIVEYFNGFIEKITTNIGFSVAVGLGVLAFTILYIILLNFLEKNNSSILIFTFTLLMLVFAVIILFVENIDGTAYLIIPAIFIVLVLILYSVEIKRAIWAKSGKKVIDVKHSNKVVRDSEKIENCINSIVKALINMSKSNIGALIILSTGNVSNQILDSGVKIDSEITSQLIESIFFPKTPLHDGALIIDDTKIVSAGCFLPVSQNIDNIPKELGTRHRAGIGVTETLDVVSLIVSEENGIISIAKAGKLTRYANTEMLKKTLREYYWQTIDK